jgi:hypothetical protein
MDTQEIADKVIAKAQKVVSRELTDLEKTLMEFAVIQVHLGLVKYE